MLRRLFAGLTIALLVLTGQQITSAQTSGPAVMQAVLCIGGGLMTVHLDADGNPVGPPHICPDATLAFLPDVAAPDLAPKAIHLGKVATIATSWQPPTRRIDGLPLARGPPLTV